jgi:hypothetical protein
LAGLKESFRGQCNLHIYFAEQYLAELQENEASGWGGHIQRATSDSLAWQLLLAYQCHLADLVDQQPKFALALPQGQFNARSFVADELPPEIEELAEREIEPGWLQTIVNYPFIQTATANLAPRGVLAWDGEAQQASAPDLAGCILELKSMIARHRATLMEY